MSAKTTREEAVQNALARIEKWREEFPHLLQPESWLRWMIALGDDYVALRDRLAAVERERDYYERQIKAGVVRYHPHEGETRAAYGRIATLERDLTALRTEADAMRAVVPFVLEALSDYCNARWWADADLQDKLEKHGLLEPVTVTEPCGSASCECEPGGQCLRLTKAAFAVRAGGAVAAKSSLVLHAERELDTIGEHTEMRSHLLRMVQAFADEWHSGFSASYAASALNKLLRFEPLAPLTGDDAEWVQVGDGLWQNARCSHVFKRESGAYDITGRIFRSPDGTCYTSGESFVAVRFPYTPKREYVDVDEDGKPFSPTPSTRAVTEAMVEAAAKAMHAQGSYAEFETWDMVPEKFKRSYRFDARAVLTAALAADAGEGDAGYNDDTDWDYTTARDGRADPYEP